MDFHLFRLSLKEKEAPDLLLHGSPMRGMDRQAWLRFIFSGERQFRHYGSNFRFIPEPNAPAQDGQLIFGWIGRERLVHERTPPEEGFEPTEHRGWLGAFVALDPAPHEDGQKVAMEHSGDIGLPRAVLSSLIDDINRDPEGPYFLQLFPIIRPGSFWQWAEEHNNAVRSLSFDVAVPNMFDGVSDFEGELRSLRNNENIASVRTKLESDDTIKHTSPRLKEIVDYVERGSGELSAEAVDGSRYSSSENQAKVPVDIESHRTAPKRFLVEIVRVLDRIF